MSHEKLIDTLWLLLVALTVGGTMLGESADPGLAVTLLICLTMAFKGRLIIDHFMELKHANNRVRTLMRAYFYVLPALTVLTWLFGDFLARLTTL